MKQYLLGIAAAAMAVSVLSSLLQGGAIRKTVLLSGSLVLALTILTPVVRGKLDSFGQYLSELELRTDAAVSGIEVQNKEILADIIAEKTETYIWDKATKLGADITVCVEVRQGDSYPYPWSAEISGLLTAAQQQSLSAMMEQELAIPKERQVFIP